MTDMGRTVPRYIKKAWIIVARSFKIAYNYIITTINNKTLRNIMRDELKEIVKKYYESELEKYKEESDEDDEECKWSVSEFVSGEIDEIMNEIIVA